MYTCTHMYVYMRTRTRTDTHTQARPCTRALLLSLASRSTEMLEHRAHRTGRMHDPNEGMFRACTTPQQRTGRRSDVPPRHGQVGCAGHQGAPSGRAQRAHAPRPRLQSPRPRARRQAPRRQRAPQACGLQRTARRRFPHLCSRPGPHGQPNASGCSHLGGRRWQR